MTRFPRLLVLGIVAIGVCSVAAVAWAFWSLNATGAAAVGVGTLDAPTGVNTNAPPGSAAVTVAWTGVTGPSGAIDGYYVTRYSGSAPSPACSSSAGALLGAGVTNCIDAAVADGSYTYAVTAVFRSWTAGSAPTTPVTVDALDAFSVSAPASTPAGSPFTITVTATNRSNTTIAGYSGTVHFVTSDPRGATVPTDYTFVAGDNGVHTFTNGVTLNSTPSQSVTVNATADVTKTGTVSVAVTVGPAAQLSFTQQPGGAAYGVVWPTQPKVTILDAGGNTVTSSVASVTLSITAGTGNASGVLTCTANPKAAVAGVDTFAGCKINLPGTGYTLTATATGLTPATSNAFNVVVGPASQVVLTQQPTAIVAGSVISPAVVAAIKDAGGNIITSSNATVTIAISTNPGGGTLTGTVSVAATNGIATFANLSIDKTGTGYKLTAASTGLTSAISGTFNVTAGTASRLAFNLQPNGGTGGVVWTTQPRVVIQDALGNTVTSSVASVTLSITAGTGNASGVLTCTANPKAAVAGVDTFAGCKINLPGTGYTLTATATGLTPATSNAFNIT